MSSRGAFAFLKILAVVLAGAPCIRADESVPPGAKLASLFGEFSPAVVRVKVATQEPDAAGRTTVLVGSGFFISETGRVLTMFDAASPISRIWVEKDGVESLAELVGTDSRTKIRLLQVVKLPESFSAIPIAAPETQLPLASPVLAISNPFAFEASPTLGLATGYESSVGQNEFPFTFLRVNIPVYEGENGSPVLDMDGHLVGIAIGNIPEIRSAYLVPTKALVRIVGDLEKDGRVHYGTLPVTFGEYPDAANVRRQVMVERVVPEGSAARAGLRSGDVIRRIGSFPVRRIHDIRDALFYASPGEFIQLEVEREGRTIPFALPIEPAQQEPEAGKSVPAPAPESASPTAGA